MSYTRQTATTVGSTGSCWGAVAKKGNIPENTDFNTITTPGMYAFNEDHIHGCSNYPFKTGTLIVFNSSGVAGGGNPKTQLFVTYTGGSSCSEYKIQDFTK